MATISSLISTLPVNPIRFLTPLVEERQKKGIDFYKINIGQPDLEVDPSISEEFLSFFEEYKHIEYTSAYGTYKTREAWAHGYYEEKFDPEEVILVNGSSEAMLLCYLALLSAGEANLTFSPIYSNYDSYATITNRKIYSIPRKFETGYRLPSKEGIENFIKDKEDIRCMTLISPDNPTGAVMTEEEIKRVFELAEEYDLWVIVDEAYRDIRFDDDTVAISDVIYDNESWMDRTVFLATTSKEFSACGLRCGALLSKNENLIQAIIKLVRPRLSINQVTQKAVRKALWAPRSERSKVRDIYKARRDIVIKKLKELGVEIHTPQGALYCLPDLKGVGIDDTFKFAQWLVEDFYVEKDGAKRSVVVTPGAGFFPKGDKDKKDSLIRIAYVLEEEKLEEAMDILGQGIEVFNSDFK